MENIFKNAKFGKAYKTRDGRKAIYIRSFITNPPSKWDYNEPTSTEEYREYCKWEEEAPDIEIHILVVKGYDMLYFNENGISDRDNINIISEWQEPIDEDKLEELAEQTNPYPFYDKSDMCVAHSYAGYNEGFIEGYRKALKQ